MLSFQQLHVYQASIQLAAAAFDITGRLPDRSGHNDLADQLWRASASIPLNIAEGAGRRTAADKARHYAIARGSAMECAAVLDVLRVRDAVSSETHEQVMTLLERIVAMLTRLV